MKDLRTLMDLSGRVALLTGGAGHIGIAMAATLAELGADICLLDLPRADPEGAAARLAAQFGVQAFGIPQDLEDEPGLRRVPARILERFGRLDILVALASFTGDSTLPGWSVPFAEQGSEAWRRVLEVNLVGAFTLIQACAPALAASGHGSIVTVGSIYGLVGPDWDLYEGTSMSNPAAYAASKGGVAQLTRWLATTLAPDIRVNCISPGGIARGQNPAFVARYEKRTPLRRMGTEEDFKGVIAFLAGDASAWVTGQNIAVDGGWTAW